MGERDLVRRGEIEAAVGSLRQRGCPLAVARAEVTGFQTEIRGLRATKPLTPAEIATVIRHREGAIALIAADREIEVFAALTLCTQAIARARLQACLAGLLKGEEISDGHRSIAMEMDE
jgi:hypothetical protein